MSQHVRSRLRCFTGARGEAKRSRRYGSEATAAHLLPDGHACRVGAHVDREQRPTLAKYRITRPFNSSS
jgi:hypothetical protein